MMIRSDPDPDPTCNNGYLKLFSSLTKYKTESTNSSLKFWFIKSNFYQIFKYFLFSFRIKVGCGSDFFSQLSRIQGKISDPHPWLNWSISLCNGKILISITKKIWLKRRNFFLKLKKRLNVNNKFWILLISMRSKRMFYDF